MRVTIIKEDNRVVVDGESHTVDCSDLPANFHALQWYGDNGEIEHSTVRCEHCGTRSKKMNEPAADLGPYQKYVDAWRVAKAKAEADATRPEN